MSTVVPASFKSFSDKMLATVFRHRKVEKFEQEIEAIAALSDPAEVLVKYTDLKKATQEDFRRDSKDRLKMGLAIMWAATLATGPAFILGAPIMAVVALSLAGVATFAATVLRDERMRKQESDALFSLSGRIVVLTHRITPAQVEQSTYGARVLAEVPQVKETFAKRAARDNGDDLVARPKVRIPLGAHHTEKPRA